MTIHAAYQKLAKYYDAIYKRGFYSDYARFVKNVISWIKPGKSRLLDAACGTGLFIGAFKKICPDATVFGFDCSENMISAARKKHKDAKFFVRSFANFKLSNKFDAVVSTFDSVNYILGLNGLKKFFINVAQHLTKEGVFIFDFNTKLKKINPLIKKNNILLVNEIKNKKFWHSRIVIKEKRSILEERHIERLYSLAEIKSVLRKSGFNKIEAYSDLEGKKDVAAVARLFVVAGKI